jgi:hypothetical protein
MSRSATASRAAALAMIVLVAACQDMPTTLAAPDDALAARSAAAPQDLAAWFARSSPEVLALPQTVFAAQDQAANKLVFGVENAGVTRGVHAVMAALGIPGSAYEVQVTEPIRFMSETLRTRHRPTLGGLQIHWGMYVCTLGFNVDHAGGRSFITNSHCTDKQGTTGTTAYYQPTSSVDGTPIAIEADDPPYVKGGECSFNKVCRYSDAARALYAEGVGNHGRIAKPTTGPNTGDLNVNGSFDITSQDNTTTGFTIGATMNKVGRTTGWSSGTVRDTCARVNVSGSNIQLLCQTIVQNSGTKIVGGGDSGSPVFTGTSNVKLVGILWGGNNAGDLFVFSPLKNIQDELGSFNATTDGVGGSGDGGGESGGGGGGDDDEAPCVPKGPNGKNCK